MALASVEVANLTGGASANAVDVGGWTGTGSLSGQGSNDTVAATKNANSTLADAALGASDGLSMTLASIEVANLTGGASANAFDVGGWTGAGAIDGQGSGRAVGGARKDNFTLADAAIGESEGLSMTLASIGVGNLTGG